MADFIGEDLHEPRFERMTMNRATFDLAELPGARFRACEITDAEVRSTGIRRVVMHGVELQDVEITGELLNVNEEWHHRTFAERDLAVLESRAG